MHRIRLAMYYYYQLFVNQNWSFKRRTVSYLPFSSWPPFSKESSLLSQIFNFPVQTLTKLSISVGESVNRNSKSVKDFNEYEMEMRKNKMNEICLQFEPGKLERPKMFSCFREIIFDEIISLKSGSKIFSICCYNFTRPKPWQMRHQIQIKNDFWMLHLHHTR